MNINRNLSIVVLLLGVVALVIGAIFIGQGVARNNQLKEAMRGCSIPHPWKDS